MLIHRWYSNNRYNKLPFSRCNNRAINHFLRTINKHNSQWWCSNSSSICHRCKWNKILMISFRNNRHKRWKCKKKRKTKVIGWWIRETYFKLKTLRGKQRKNIRKYSKNFQERDKKKKNKKENWRRKLILIFNSRRGSRN